MVEIALDKDEIWPYFVADDDYITPEYHDAIVWVDNGWWEEYSMVRAKFWDMQEELRALYYGGALPEDDCE